MWYVTGHPLQGGVRGPRGSRELAEAGTRGGGAARNGGGFENRTRRLGRLASDSLLPRPLAALLGRSPLLLKACSSPQAPPR
jgi:hypothetical protein